MARYLHKYRDREIGKPCPLCGESMTEEGRHRAGIDHIIPRSHGGPAAKWNFRIICARCNLVRGTNCEGFIAGLAMSLWEGISEPNRSRSYEPNSRLLVSPEENMKRSWRALLWDALHDQPWLRSSRDWRP